MQTHPKTAEARLLANQNKLDQAWDAIQIALKERPDDYLTLMTAAETCARRGKAFAALPYSSRAFELFPHDQSAVVLYAVNLIVTARHAEAIPILEAFLEKHPDSHASAANLCAAYVKNEQWVKAERLARARVPTDPNPRSMLINLAMSLHEQGRTIEACIGIQQLMQAKPDDTRLLVSLASFTNYLANCPDNELLMLHKEVGRQLAKGVSPVHRPPGRATAGKIRVGLLSSDLRHHPVSFFLLPLAAHFDRQRFELCLYHTNSVCDRYTQRFQEHASIFRQLHDHDDRDLAEIIARDRPDVLIELAGLTSNNRLGVLAHRPAPVQATYLGYPATSGCPFIDFRLVDALTDPPGAEALHTERLIRMDPCFLCFRPPDDAPADQPSDHDADPSRPLTFGCFGILCKYNDRTIDLWCRVLDAVPGSRLFLKSTHFIDADLVPLVKERFTKRGVDPARLELVCRAPSHAEHLAMYRRVDIALDTVPYCGTTTTCEATLMGVPTVTLVGHRHAQRVGLSILTNLGLPELAAASEDRYIAIARDLAMDVARRRELRAGMRERMLRSPICDEPAFARHFERAVEQMAGAAARR